MSLFDDAFGKSIEDKLREQAQRVATSGANLIGDVITNRISDLSPQPAATAPAAASASSASATAMTLSLPFLLIAVAAGYLILRRA